MTPPSLAKIGAALAKAYGKAPAPPSTDPFALIVWEQVAYLADDDTRSRAFTRLVDACKRKLTAKNVLAIAPDDLVAITREGGAVAAEERADRIRESARIVVDEHGGDLAKSLVAMKDVKARKKALKKFASIGEPGAEKILLMSGIDKALGLESNGLRVLVRIGVADEDKSYDKMWKAARTAVDDDVNKAKHDDVIEWHTLLRRHGQTICTRSKPQCPSCQVRAMCRYGAP